MILKQFHNISGKVYATVSYDQVSNCIVDEWEGFFGLQQNFKDVLNFIAGVIEEKQVDFWLADLSKMQGSFDESKEWLVDVIMPRVIEAGLQAEAIVQPKNIFSKLSVQDAIIKIHDFEMRQFENVELARNWLLSSLVASGK